MKVTPSTNIRVLDDSELDFVSGGLDEGEVWSAAYFEPPSGFSYEDNTSSYIYQDASGNWFADLYYEYGGGAYEGAAGGIESDGGTALDFGSAGGKVTVPVNKPPTSTSSTHTFTIKLFGIVSYTYTKTTTTTSGGAGGTRIKTPPNVTQHTSK